MTASALPPGTPAVLTPGEVARLYRVDIKTVGKWADSGKITAIRAGARGHRRYPAAQFADILAVTGWPV